MAKIYRKGGYLILVKIPCKDCMLVPICRHKCYEKFLTDCSLVCKFIDNNHKDKITGKFWTDMQLIIKTIDSQGFHIVNAESVRYVENNDRSGYPVFDLQLRNRYDTM